MISSSTVALMLSLFISWEDKEVSPATGEGIRVRDKVAWRIYKKSQACACSGGGTGVSAPFSWHWSTLHAFSRESQRETERENDASYLEPLGAIEARVVHPRPR